MRLLSAALVGLALFATPAVALTNGPQLAAQAAEGLQALQRHAAEVAAAGKRMDLTTAPARDYLGRIIDAKGLAGLPAPSASDLPWMIELLQSVSAVNRTLLFFGADPKQVNFSSPPQVLIQNAKQYQDQLTSTFVFQMRLFPRIIVGVDAFAATLTPVERNSKVRQDGLAKMQRGSVESIQGALGFAADPQTSAENVRLITTAVSDTVAVWNKFATADDRRLFAHIISAIRTKPIDGKTDGNLAALSSALD
jgi:hypothetical protein